jgi:DNA polymerase-1
MCVALCCPAAAPPQVSSEARERAKRVVYGIVYGQTSFGLAQQLADQGVSTGAAQAMIDGFLARFPGERVILSH